MTRPGKIKIIGNVCFGAMANKTEQGARIDFEPRIKRLTTRIVRKYLKRPIKHTIRDSPFKTQDDLGYYENDDTDVRKAIREAVVQACIATRQEMGEDVTEYVGGVERKLEARINSKIADIEQCIQGLDDRVSKIEKAIVGYYLAKTTGK